MSGHNKWSKIKRGKAVEDAKRGAVFTRIGNQIALAARSGAEPRSAACACVPGPVSGWI